MQKRKSLLTNYFKPSMYIRSFKDLNVSQIKRQGIKLFVSDLDNTLVPHFTKLPNKDVLGFIQKIKKVGIDFVLMSNNSTKRTKLFADKANIHEYYGNARKPFKKIAKQIMAKRPDIKNSEIIIMGDQIIMDILVANRMKWESILVQPLVSTNYEMNFFNLFLERKIYHNLDRKNILKQNYFANYPTSSKPELL